MTNCRVAVAPGTATITTMTRSSFPHVWRRRLIWLRGLLVLCLSLALLMLRRLSPVDMPPLEPVLWLAALLLPSVLTLATLNRDAQQRLLTLELILDALLFLGLMQIFGGTSNPLTFYLLIPLLLGGLTLTPLGAGLMLAATLTGYLLVGQWHHMPAPHSTLHALTRELSGVHSLGMTVVFIAMAALLTLLGQVIQRLSRAQQRQQEQLIELAGRRERMYQVAATLANQAHELNTPLSTLVMLADNARREPGLPDITRQDLEQIEALARRVAGQLRQSDQPPFPEQLSFQQLAEQVRRQLRHLHPTLKISVEGPGERLFRNAPDWFRVLSNLGYNAIDAGADHLALHLAGGPDHWVLQVSDNGPDHPQKSTREGLGIGLALVESTLDDLGARLQLGFHHQWSQARIEWSDHGDA